MKRRIFIYFTLLLFIFTLGGCKTNKASLTQEEKIADFNYMYEVLKNNYPYFEVNKRLNGGLDWLSNKEDYVDEIKSTQNDEEFYNKLQEILADLNNGHTDMMDKAFYEYVKKAYNLQPKMNEAWLNQLNNTKAVERYGGMKSSSRLPVSSDSKTPDNVKTEIIDNGKAAYFSIKMLNGFNIESDMKIIKPFLKSISSTKALIIDIRGNSGGDSRYWSDNIVPMLINKTLSNKEYIAYRGGKFTEEFLKSRYGTGYEKLQLIENINKENLKNLPAEVMKDFKYYSISVTKIEPKDSIDYKGKIYLLVDGSVFSSSEAFAAFSKGTGFAVLVGEKTGGDGIGFDPAVCTLPNSGFVFRFTQEMGLTSDGSCNFESKTEPDIKVSAKKNADLNKDEAVQTVLKLIK
ncbi:MAG: S41 family peptidase [Bacillota bacterium]|nr:S41 family peptidase [Bacillota bacterium]